MADASWPSQKRMVWRGRAKGGGGCGLLTLKTAEHSRELGEQDVLMKPHGTLVLGVYPVDAFASCGALRTAERGIGSRLVGKVLTSA